MQTYLWGKVGPFWHALTRHDPDYTNMLAPYQPAPGTATTVCGLTKQPLERLGVDPEETDALCPSCQAQAAKV